MEIIIAIAILGGLGLIFGLVLGVVIAGSQWLMKYMEKKNKKKEAAK